MSPEQIRENKQYCALEAVDKAQVQRLYEDMLHLRLLA